MKLAERHNNVVSGGDIGENSVFSIAMNAKMFRTLSDTMYQDKIGSMIRELSCNAMDAHIAAGQPNKPFTIHLPDQIEPWFSVKDEGIGMSDEDVRAMYTTYGESTKDQSNDMVGAFGLGSKTPFAYTDQFTVTSIFEGVRRIYVAVMNDDGLPILKLQGESETTEHAGLEVNVSVSDYDFQTFRSKVTEQLKFFSVKPNLSNNRHDVKFFDLDAEATLIEKDDVRVFTGGYNSRIRGVWIVQGGVGYKLDLSKLGDMDQSTKAFAVAIENKNAVIEFTIGDIEVTASREGISYTPNTVKRIVKKLSETAATIAAETIAELRKLDNIWERAVKYNGLIDVMQRAVRDTPDFDKLFPEARVGMLSNTKQLYIKVKPIKEMGLNVAAYVKHSGRRRGNWNTFTKMLRKTVVDDTDWNRGSNINLHPEVEMYVFIRDTNSKPVARINHFAEENGFPNILVIEGFKDDVTADDIKKVAKALSMPVREIKRLSTLVAPKAVNNGSGGIARPRAYRMGTNDSTYSSKEWDAVYDNLDDLKDDVIWVKMERHDIDTRGDVNLLLEGVKKGVVKQTVIAVNGQTASRIENGKVGGQLTSAEEAAKKIRAKVNSLMPTFRAIAKYRAFIKKTTSGNKHVATVANCGTTNLSSVRTRHEQLCKRIAGWEWAQNFVKCETINDASLKGETAGEKYRAVIVERYPLLQYLNQYSDIPQSEVEDYVKMMDLQKSL